jgi:hypothetical protein
MGLRNNVTFNVSIPFDRNRHPIGEEVAAHLVSAIEERSGLHASIEDWRDSGFELDFVINGRPLHFAFVHVDDPRFQFYGQVASYVGWIRRLLGYRDREEEETLIRALHGTLTADSHVSDVLWHEAWYDESRSAKEP